MGSEMCIRDRSAPAPESKPAKSGGGRQTMEDIRKSLVANAEPLKKEDKRASSKEPPAKKAKHAAAEAPRRARMEPTPPPQPSLPEPLLYFLRYVTLLTDQSPAASAGV